MQLSAFIFNPEIENGFRVSDIDGVSLTLKEFPVGSFRSNYLYETAELDANLQKWQPPVGKKYGNFYIAFRIRKAKDILFEGASYADLDIHVEVNGKRLPELPAQDKLSSLLNESNTLIIINERQYKPETEVFGFQQVYDDSVICIEQLKKLGVPQEAMSIYATPNEISLEVHAGIIGLEGDENLHQKYHNLLCNIGNIQNNDGNLIKQNIRTILVDSTSVDFQILVPGCFHPTLKRPKVSVGTSHFAYGIAAFSDFCGKKRTPDECLQESLGWVKFVKTDVPPIQSLKQAVEAFENVPMLGQSASQKSANVSGTGGFLPFSSDIAANYEKIIAPLNAFPSKFLLLDKSLGGGWKKKEIHVITGKRECGKATFLQNLAFSFIRSAQIMFISFEQSMKEFLVKASVANSRINRSDLLAQTAISGPKGDGARNTLGKMIKALTPKLGENFYFRGTESSIKRLNTEEIRQLIGMMPENSNRILFLESVTDDMLTPEIMAELDELSSTDEVTIFMSAHTEQPNSEKANVIDVADHMHLKLFQKYCESVSILDTQKAHLRKFVGIMKGQIDPQLVTKLEQKALQASGNKRLATDAFSMHRLIHTRSGRRELTLMLYQPDLLSFFELTSIKIGKA